MKLYNVQYSCKLETKTNNNKKAQRKNKQRRTITFNDEQNYIVAVVLAPKAKNIEH